MKIRLNKQSTKHRLANVLGITCAILTLFLAAGCSSNSSSSKKTSEAKGELPEKRFSLEFSAKSADLDVDCDVVLYGLGAEHNASIGLNDLRFYVSNLTFYDKDNKALAVTMDSNTFQYNSTAGNAALIDLASNKLGTCDGTERTNRKIVGQFANGTVASVSFDVGVPQALMKQIIATHTQENAPSPFNEMFWNWASGYRHFMMNFTVFGAEGDEGDGDIHIGSRACGGGGLKALEAKDSCDYVNTPKVLLVGFDIAKNSVVVDIDQLLKNLPFKGYTYNSDQPPKVIDEFPGVACHSNIEMQSDCTPIFNNLGIDLITGNSGSEENSVFTFE